MSSLVDGLKTVWETLTNIPHLIWDKFSSGFTSIVTWLVDIFNNLVELPTKIKDGIKEVFIPDTEDINTMFNNALQSIRSKFGFQEFNLNALTNTSSTPQNITHGYRLYYGGMKKYTFFDTKYLIIGVEYFRPFIRGFIVLLLIFYNVKNFLSFIGHDIGVKEVKNDN